MIAEYNFKNFPTKDYEKKESGIINSPKVIFFDSDDYGHFTTKNLP